MLKVKVNSLPYLVFFAVLFFPFCVTGTFSYTLPIVYRVSIYLRYLSCAIIISRTFWYMIREDHIWMTVIELVFLFVVFASTVVNGLSLVPYITYAVKVVFFSCYFTLAFYSHSVEMYLAVWWICFILTVVNIASILLYPNGLYIRYDLFSTGEGMAYWFLGNRNLYIDYLFPMIICSLIVQYITQESYMKFYISVLLGIITVVLTGSATTIFVLTIIALYYIIFRKGLLKKIVNPIYMILVYGIVTLIIICFSNTKVFSFIIVNVFKKDLTLSYRTEIWRNVIEHILLKPIVGYGYRSGDHFIDNSQVMHAHNLFLHFAYSGGIIAMLLLIALMIYAAFRILKINKKSSGYVLFTFIFFSYLWMEFSEPRIYFPFLFAVLVISGNAYKFKDIRKRYFKNTNDYFSQV